MNFGDTIAAVSTPRGKGGVALLRVSGPDAVPISSKIFFPKNGRPLASCAPRTAVYGSILAPEPDGSFLPVDDGIATVFRVPASFTGEDTVEICCHGGILLTETVLTSLLAAGARAAEAGEFTRRAFLNGKMGLSSAEALGNLLEAQTREQITLAHGGLGGKLEEKSRAIFESVRDVLAGIYVKIDYPDEDLADMSREEILASLDTSVADLESLAATYRTGHAVAEGIPTAIVGRPNVGKSSLYNRILGEDAAIVTSVEGTTRDVLTATASFGKVTLRLSDTAGIRDTSDPVERIGVERAQKTLDSAELILAVFDASVPPTAEDLALAERLSDVTVPVIAVLNKSDLGDVSGREYRSRFVHCVSLSAGNGEGIGALRDLAESLFASGDLDLCNDAILTNARQNGAVLSALASLRSAADGLRAGLPLDVCCTDAENAMESLAELDGRAVSEEIVSQIFSHFCVGK